MPFGRERNLLWIMVGAEVTLPDGGVCRAQMVVGWETRGAGVGSAGGMTTCRLNAHPTSTKEFSWHGLRAQSRAKGSSRSDAATTILPDILDGLNIRLSRARELYGTERSLQTVVSGLYDKLDQIRVLYGPDRTIEDTRRAHRSKNGVEPVGQADEQAGGDRRRGRRDSGHQAAMESVSLELAMQKCKARA